MGQPIRMTEAQVRAGLKADTAICLACGEHDDGHEPDTRHRKCPACGLHQLTGLEWLISSEAIEFVEES